MIKWGILGLGKMGLAFANSIKETSNSKLISIASKSGKTFNNYKNEDYESLINNQNIDAVYISTLNNTHLELIKKLSKASKNILCEKPFSITLAEAVEAQKNVKNYKINFFEGIAYYSHPQTIELLKIINRDEIGEIKKIESSFGFKAKVKPDSRLFNKNLGGGAILDVGCYPISFLMLFCKKLDEFKIKSKKLSFSSTGVDDEAQAEIICNNSIEAKIHVSLKSNLPNNCTIYGTKRNLIISNPWLPQKKSVLEVNSNNRYYKNFINSKLSLYANQIQNVSDIFLSQKKDITNLFDIEKSLICMNLIEKWRSN